MGMTNPYKFEYVGYWEYPKETLNHFGIRFLPSGFPDGCFRGVCFDKFGISAIKGIVDPKTAHFNKKHLSEYGSIKTAGRGILEALEKGIQHIGQINSSPIQNIEHKLRDIPTYCGEFSSANGIKGHFEMQSGDVVNEELFRQLKEYVLRFTQRRPECAN
jgi:hypothetical protein